MFIIRHKDVIITIFRQNGTEGKYFNLYRAGTALLLGLGLILIEAYIVMVIKDYSAVRLGTIGQFLTVWVINSLLVFAILTDIKQWLSKRGKTELQHEL